MKLLNLFALIILLSMGASIPAKAGTPSQDAHKFKSSQLCRGGVIYEDEYTVQCKTDRVKASLNTTDDGYRSITFTIYADDKAVFYKKDIQPLVLAIRSGLEFLGRDITAANYFATLPTSTDWNKTQYIRGAKFNIPSAESAKYYKNYMVTLTK